jgi:hypothetical protein
MVASRLDGPLDRSRINLPAIDPESGKLQAPRVGAGREAPVVLIT